MIVPRNSYFFATVLSLCSFAAASFPQEARPEPKPRFDVASVKLADSGTPAVTRGGPGTADPGRFTFARANLALMVMQAFGVPRDQVIGPGLSVNGNGYGYDISATMPPNTTKEQFGLMLQDLLASRFHMQFHHEQRPFPGYELGVSAKGARLKAVSPESCPSSQGPPARSPGLITLSKAADGFPVIPSGWQFAVDGPLMSRGVQRARFCATIPQLIESLPPTINKSIGVPGAPLARIVNNTGLDGYYEFTLEYEGGFQVNLARGAPMAQQQAGASNSSDPSADAGAPDLPKALEQQIGLTLKKTKDMNVDVIVVDYLDRFPVAN